MNFAFFIKPALAQITNPVLPTQLGGAGAEAGIGSLISSLVGVFLIVGAIAALIFLLMGGVKWITSSGDKARLEQAREQITQAIVGLIVLAAVWAIMSLISGFLGLGEFGSDSWKLELPTLLDGSNTNTTLPNANTSCTTFGLKPSENGGKSCCTGLSIDPATKICTNLKQPSGAGCSNNSECASGNCRVGGLLGPKTCQ